MAANTLAHQIDVLKGLDNEARSHFHNYFGELKDFLKDYSSIQMEAVQKQLALCKRYQIRINGGVEPESNASQQPVNESQTQNQNQQPEGFIQAMRKILNHLANEANSKRILCSQLNRLAKEGVKKPGQRLEKMRRDQFTFLTSLLQEHDELVGQKEKALMASENVAEAVAHAKLKYEQASTLSDESNLSKLKKAWQSQLINSNQAKNDLKLCTAAVLNLQKRWKLEFIPALHSMYRSMEEYRCVTLKSALTRTVDLLSAHSKDDWSKWDSLLEESIHSIDPVKDSLACVPLSLASQSLSDSFSTSVEALECTKPLGTVLLNQMQKALTDFESQSKSIHALEKELQGLGKLHLVYRDNPALGESHLVYESFQTALRKLLIAKVKIIPSAVVIERVRSVLLQLAREKRKQLSPDESTTNTDELAATSSLDWFFYGHHTLVNPSALNVAAAVFTRECSVCRTSLWGEAGLTCSACNSFYCHRRCELRAPFTCHNHLLAKKVSSPSSITLSGRETPLVTSSPSKSLKFRFWRSNSSTSTAEAQLDDGDARKLQSNNLALSLINDEEGLEKTLALANYFDFIPLLGCEGKKIEAEPLVESQSSSTLEEEDNNNEQEEAKKSSEEEVQAQEAVVIYDFQSTGDSELSVKMGETVFFASHLEADAQCKHYQEAGWSLVKKKSEPGTGSNGSEPIGYIPTSYLKPLIAPTSTSSGKETGKTPKLQALGENSGTLPRVIQAVAIYEYEGTANSEELSFEKGDVIWVVRRGADGWSEGLIKDKYGIFPTDYVEFPNEL